MITLNFGPDEVRSTDFVGPIIIEDVYIGDDGGYDIAPVVKIRIREEASDEEWPGARPYFYVLEYEYRCVCNAPNWIQFGTDPSEYRCIKCTEWL